MNDNEMQECLRIVLAVIVIIIFIFFIHNLWIKVVSTPLSSKGIEGDVHGVLVRLNGLNAMINGSKPLIHMSDERCKLTIQVGYHGIKGESLRRRRSNWSLRSIFDIGGWHTLWKLDIVHLFTIGNGKICRAIDLELFEDMNQGGTIGERLHTRKMEISHKIGAPILTEAIDPKSTNLSGSRPLTFGGPKAPSHLKMEKEIVSIKDVHGTKLSLPWSIFICNTHVFYAQRIRNHLGVDSESHAHKIGFNNNDFLLSFTKDTPRIGVENKHKIVIIVPGRSKIGHKLPLPKESKIMEVERVRGEEGNGNPTLTTNTVILKLLEVLQSIGMTRFIEAPIEDDVEVRFGTIMIRDCTYNYLFFSCTIKHN
ncbi:hypothetical protein GQ457_10G005550 [Hibiscus cannabinus]